MFIKACVLAHINYAFTVWSSASDVHLKKQRGKKRKELCLWSGSKRVVNFPW